MDIIKEDLKHQDKILRMILDLMPDPIAIHSEGIVRYINDVCLKLLKAKSKDEIIGKQTLSFVHENYKKFVEERIKELKSGTILKDLVEEIFLDLEGNPIFVEVAAAPIQFEGKDSIIVVFRNITERKKNEKKLLHFESLLKSIHKIDQLLLVKKRKKILLKSICENLIKVKGYGLAWIGKFHDKKALPMVECAEKEFLKEIKEKKIKMPETILASSKKIVFGKIPFKFDEFSEWNNLCKEFNFKSFCFIPIKIKNKIWGVLSLYAFEEELFDKEERTFLGEIASEIGMALYSLKLQEEEKKAKKELKISEGKMKALLDALNDTVFSLDKKGRFVFFHSKVKEYPNTSVDQFIGKNFKDVMPSSFSSKLSEAFKKVIKGESEEFEYWDTSKNKTLWFSVKLSPLYYKNKIKGIVGVARDITEKVLMEADRINTLYKVKSTLESTVMALANAVELRDATTYGHQERTAKLACAIAQKLGLPKDKIEGLRLAAHVHDIGKIAIPAEILAKPGKLLPIEFELIRTHAQKGFELLKGIDFPWPVSKIVLQHSEHIDGSGYPQGLKGDEILQEAKILAVADAIDAMCSHRPYRPAMPIGEVIKQIKELSGKWYDEKVVEAAVELLESGFRWF